MPATAGCTQISKSGIDYCTWAIQRKWERNDSRSHTCSKTKSLSETEIEVSGNE